MSAPARILIVDDTPANREFLVDLLEEEGYLTLSAASAAEAMAVIEREMIDLVLLDLALPDLDGDEICRRLRARPETETLPILLITAVESGTARVKGLDAGADGVLPKPVNRLALLARVRSLIRVHKLYRQLAQSENLFRGILETVPDGVVITDTEGRILVVNTQAEALFGYPRQELIGQPVELLMPERTRAMGSTPNIAGRRKDGSEFPADISLSTLPAADGVLAITAVRDISERVATEKELRRINRTLRMSSRCGEAIVRARDESELLETVCRYLIDLGGYGLAWVAYPLHDAGQPLQLAAYAGAGKDYLELLQAALERGEQGPDCARTAIRESRPVVARKLPALSECVALPEEAIALGFMSCIALPLHCKGATTGALGLYSEDVEAFDLDEVRLLEQLAGNLAYGIGNLRETQVRAQFERELDYRTNYDPLTGLPNRNLLLDRLQRAIVQCARAGRLAAVLVVNLDRFTVINDSLGYLAGNELLKQIGRHLCARLREGDTAARLSADVFAVVLSDVTQAEDAGQVAGKLLEAVAQPLALEGCDISSSASIGISVYPRDGDDAANLVKNAETAMRNAKACGGATFRFYAQKMNQRQSARFALETDLRRAIADGELLLHFQPRVNLRSGNIVGAEALVRWQHAERGLIPPGEFIPLAEESGLILPLGKWVIDTTCRQIRAWLDQGLPVEAVAVNLSARQFRQGDLAQTIRDMLQAYRLDARLLELEITESTVMQNMEATCRTLHELKAIGIKLSLDDFGTGYSSLSYLKRFPIDHLKIDRTFVRDLTTDPDDAAICIAVIGLAHSLKLSVIAEGVETEGQMNYLRMHDCDDIQGYYFSRPLPADDFARLLAGWQPPPLAPSDDKRQTLLIVDDEPNVVRALTRALRREGYQIFSAGSAQEGLDILATHDVHVILSDQRMPNMSGTEFLSRVRYLYPETIRIVLSGYTELTSVTDAINRGAIYKFLTKPWEDNLLREQVREAFRHYHAASFHRTDAHQESDIRD